MASKRPKRDRETAEYLGAARRFIKGAGRRVADADEVELAELLELQTVLNEAIATAMAGQMSYGRSWSYIAQATGTTRQAARQRWAKLVERVKANEC